MKTLPIIQSLAETDFYQFTVLGLIHEKRHSNVPVKYEFFNRTKNVDLNQWVNVNQLREEIDYCRTLRFQPDEIDFLRQQGCFSESFLAALTNLRLPEIDVISAEKVVIEGTWFWGILQNYFR